MKKLFCILLPLIVCMLSACDSKNHDSKPNIEFIIDSRIKTTPVKDQGHSTLCWIYAMLATIESDRLMIGDSVDLSADYLARMMLSYKATQTHFSQRPPSMRGMMTMTPQLMEQYGMMPYDSYHADKPANYMAIARKMAKLGRIRSSARKCRRPAGPRDRISAIPYIYVRCRIFASGVCPQHLSAR